MVSDKRKRLYIGQTKGQEGKKKMLKTNSKKARENLKTYIIESTHHDDESPAEN